LNKNELINSISKNAKLSKKQANAALDATLDSISDTLRRGQRVALIGFGTFGTVVRKARKGINPKTRQVIKIAQKRVAKFKAGKQLSKLVSKLK
jgi:nucleoid DNA-binding protein